MTLINKDLFFSFICIEFTQAQCVAAGSTTLSEAVKYLGESLKSIKHFPVIK